MRQIAVCILCGGNQTFTSGFWKEILREEGKIIYMRPHISSFKSQELWNRRHLRAEQEEVKRN